MVQRRRATVCAGIGLDCRRDAMAETAARFPRLRLLAASGVLTGLTVALAWGWGLVRFAEDIPAAVIDLETPTDAIVVLTGGSERLSTGVALLSRGLARQVFVSGVHPDVDTAAMVHSAGVVADDLIDRIAIGHGARDTAGNARETAAWMQSHDYRSLRLVTASYHMPRSLLEFTQALPDATIIPNPVFPSHVKQARWWAWPGTAALIISEYNKFLWSLAHHGLTALFAGARSRPSTRASAMIAHPLSCLLRLLASSWTIVLCILYLPLLAAPRHVHRAAVRFWAWGLLVTSRDRVRVASPHRRPGTTSRTVRRSIAAKHQSAWETVALLVIVGRPVFVLKQELLRVPLIGWHFRKFGNIGIDRMHGARALRAMVPAASAALAAGYQVIVFPEGTRVGVGEHRAYQPGIAAIYARTAVPVIPVALDSGPILGPAKRRQASRHHLHRVSSGNAFRTRPAHVHARARGADRGCERAAARRKGSASTPSREVCRHAGSVMNKA